MYRLRLKMGLTQRRVAEAVGISQSSYAMIESGRRHPRKEVEKKLADFFGVTVDELFLARIITICDWRKVSRKRKAAEKYAFVISPRAFFEALFACGLPKK